MKDKTKKLLLSLGVMPNLRGFRYLCDAIDLYNQRGGDISITKELYPAIAAKHNTTSSRMERCIRTVIDTMTDHVPADTIADILGVPPSNLTGTYKNSELIALCALKVKE